MLPPSFRGHAIHAKALSGPNRHRWDPGDKSGVQVNHLWSGLQTAWPGGSWLLLSRLSGRPLLGGMLRSLRGPGWSDEEMLASAHLDFKEFHCLDRRCGGHCLDRL